MKKKVLSSFILLCALVLSIVPVSAIAIEKGILNVSYTSEKEVSPDAVQVSIAVRTESIKSMEEAVRLNKDISDKVYSYLKNEINKNNGDYIKTSNYSASPNYVYKDGKRIFDKYTVSNDIIFYTKNLDKISTVIDKSLKLGATEVNSLNFSLSEKDDVCNDLMSKSANLATKRAEIIATSMGSVIDGIKQVDTSCSVNSPRNPVYQRSKYMMTNAMATMDAAPEASPIESGTIKVYATVNSSFYLK